MPSGYSGYSPIPLWPPEPPGSKESRNQGPQDRRVIDIIQRYLPAILPLGQPRTHTHTQLHSVTLKKPAPPKPKPTAAHAAGGAAVVAAPAAPGAVGRPVPAVPEASTHTRLFPLMLLGYDYYR